MVNVLLAYWKEDPHIQISFETGHPLALPSGCPEAFSGKEPNWDLLRSHYGSQMIRNAGTSLEWREVSTTFSNYELDTKIEANLWDGNRIKAFPIDSFTIQAMRRGREFWEKGATDYGNYIETCTCGFLKSGDNKRVLMGIRGGTKDGAGSLMVAPAGSMTYGLQFDHAFSKEAHEELGIDYDMWQDIRMIGLFRQEAGGSSPGNNFHYVGIQAIPLDVICERHARSMAYYQELKENCPQGQNPEAYARQKLAEMAKVDTGFIKDAWENSDLRVMPNDPDYLRKSLQEIVQAGLLKSDVNGAFALYFLHEFGRKEYEKLMEMEGFKGSLEERFLFTQ